MVLSHLLANVPELSGGLSHHHLQLVVSPLADGLVLGGELSGQLGAASSGLGASVGDLVVLVHGVGKVIGGLLGVGLNLSSVSGNMLVGLVDARVDSRGSSGKSTLLSQDLVGQVLGCQTLVGLDGLTKLAGATNVRLVTLVLEGSGGGELSLHELHGPVKVVLCLLGVGSHLGEHGLLELGTGSLVEGE